MLFDALGTLVELEPPGPRLAALLAARHGLEPDGETLERALRAEISHYRANCSRGADDASLHALRLECARVLARELGCDVAAEALLPTLLDAIVFNAYADAAPAVAALRAEGVKVAVVSNWDVSLHGVLARLGLSFDAVLTSAEAAAPKPHPQIFAAALARLGTAPADALHVGDSVEEDVGGARAAGVEPVLLARDGEAAPAGVRTIASLEELAA